MKNRENGRKITNRYRRGGVKNRKQDEVKWKLETGVQSKKKKNCKYKLEGDNEQKKRER